MTPQAAQQDPELGAIVTGWLIKLAVTIGLLGLVAFDGVAVAEAQFGAADDATTAANAAADSFHTTHNRTAAIAAAQTTLTHPGEKIAPHSFLIGPTGEVTLKVERKAQTTWMQRVPGLKDHLVATGAGSGAPSSS